MKKILHILASLTIVLICISAIIACSGSDGNDEQTTLLESVVDINMVKSHQFELQEIAEQNGNTRVSGGPGHDQSAQYVMEQLRLSGYAPTMQEFTLSTFREVSTPAFRQVSPRNISFQPNSPEGFITTRFSAAANLTAEVQAVDLIVPMDPNSPASTSNSGCEPEDFVGFTEGNIALLQRGGCSFDAKVTNAQNASASGVIIMNEGQPDRIEAISSNLSNNSYTIPSIFTTYNIGAELYNEILNGNSVVVNLNINTASEDRLTYNVFAETPGGDERNTIMVGAHLDSAAEGPGINDNGSGSAAILEVANKIGQLNIKPRNKIRFAFWSAEEDGLVGSESYLVSLSTEEISKISMYLNFDMIASPNYVRFVMDGDGSDSPNPGPAGSEKAEELFNEYFSNLGLPTDPTPIDGYSDYASFVLLNIPVGGIYSGSSEVKTEEQVNKYGGTAGQICDPNYHTPNDTVDNLNYTIEEQMLKAIAYGVMTYANSSPTHDWTINKSYQPDYSPTYQGPYAIR